MYMRIDKSMKYLDTLDTLIILLLLTKHGKSMRNLRQVDCPIALPRYGPYGR